LPSLALHVLLYEAFGWKAPQFAHLPLILKPVGKGKLSKRDGDKLGFPVFPLAYTNPTDGSVSSGYREEGYFPDAFINMLAFLGWNPGTEKELFTLAELCEAFDLQRVSKSGAKFSVEKTHWYNQQYLQLKPNQEIAVAFENLLTQKGVQTSTTYVETVVGLLKERAVFIKDLWELGRYFFETPNSYDEKAVKKQWKEGTADLMKELVVVLNQATSFESNVLESSVKDWIQSKEIGFGKVMPPLRICVVGGLNGPHLFDIMSVIGKEETIKRIHNAIEVL